MNPKKRFLPILVFALILLSLTACGSKSTTTPAAPADLTGHWEDTASSFSLDLAQNGDQLQGSHVAVAQQGNKIDSLELSITGTVQGNTADVQFQSSFAPAPGTARITFVDAGTIFWEVTVPPAGEYYLPAESTLLKTTASAPSPSPAIPAEPARIQFEPNAVSWQSTGELAPGAALRFVLYALKGQPMTVELTTVPDPGPGPSASVVVSGENGRALTSDLTTRWQGILTFSQDYYIEVRSLSPQSLHYTLLVAIPAAGTTPYVPVPLAVCQMLQEMAAQALPAAAFTLEASVTFTDYITSETGLGCSLTAKGTGLDFSDPNQVTASLVNAFLGFTESITYQAGGPTGAATAVTRDLALVLIRAEWLPAPGAQCPADQPISSCPLTPEQKLYTVTIQAAMK